MAMYSKLDVFNDKFKAFFVHLAISVALVSATYLLIRLLWYPSPLIKATDTGKIFIMILLVDLVLGPLLTFIVYKKNKRTLHMDLTIIVLIQLSALGYGLYSVYEARPVWMAYVADRFELVRVNDIIEDTEHEYDLPKLGPQYVYVDLERLDASEKLDSILKETEYNISPAQRPKFYNNFDLAKPLIVKNSQDIVVLNDYNDPDKVNNILQKYPKADSFVPLKANAVDMTVLLDKNNDKSIIAIVDLRPW